MTQNSPARTRVPRAEREVQILDEAEAVFAERGLHGTTMVDVAERVGITKPLIYDYFGSKERLLAAVVERVRLRLLAVTTEAWFGVPAGGTLRQRFEACLHAYFEFIDQYSGTYVLLQAEGGLVGEAAATIERVRTSQARAIANALRTVPQMERASDVELEGFAEAFIGTCDRLSVWREAREDVSVGDAVDIVMKTLWSGLALYVPEDER